MKEELISLVSSVDWHLALGIAASFAINYYLFIGIEIDRHEQKRKKRYEE